MLEIFNTLQPFFEDNYRRINVREYARLRKISAPTASKILANLKNEGILKEEEDRQFRYYFANKDSALLVELSRIYWRLNLKKSGLLELLNKAFLSPVIILFGSMSKAEVKQGSDMDLAMFTPTKKEIKVEKYEKLLKRKIQIFIFPSIADVKNKELLNNILNGQGISGSF